MASRNFTFTVGPTPNKLDDEGNGRWSARADSAEHALRAILGSVTFPGELTGRFEGVFVEGVSLPGRRDSEVIQLWSDQPEVIARTAAFGDAWAKANPPGSHLFAFPQSKSPWLSCRGLEREIAVEDVAQFLVPLRPIPSTLLLPAPGDQTALSPIGQIAAAGVSLENRLRIYLTAQDARLRQLRSQLEIEETAGELKSRMMDMNRQLFVLNTYMHGLSAAEIVHRGDRAPAEAPYHVFQSRLYLDQEIGLLVNLVDFDFRHVAELDEWLVETGHWRKLLPHPKTILVTRIRAQKADYEGASSLEAMIWNHWNMQNLVWVRDGDFVFRFATDLGFDNTIFKSSNEVEKVERTLREAVFASRFKRGESSSTEKPGLDGAAAEVELPYHRVAAVSGYRTISEWLESEDYRPETDAAIREAARGYVEGCNIKRLPFLVLLQGMVDSTTVLNIPPGTNLLDPVAIGRYFRLVYDKDGAISDPTAGRAFAAQVAPANLKKGDWIVGRVGRDRGICARFYQVVSVQPDGVTVRYTPTSRRWPYSPLKTSRTRKMRRFIPTSLSLELVTRLLDDREWKIRFSEIVPILAKWKNVQRYVDKSPQNEGTLDLGNGLSVIQNEDQSDE